MADTPTGTQDTPQPTSSAPVDTPQDTLAAQPGPDSLVGTSADTVAPIADVADAVTGPWKAPSSPEKANPPSPQAPAKNTDAGPSKNNGNVAKKAGGGGKRALVLMILVVLAAGGGYASYPMWRPMAEPYAAMLGLTLPPMMIAEQPTSAPPATVSSTTTAQTTAQTAAKTPAVSHSVAETPAPSTTTEPMPAPSIAAPAPTAAPLTQAPLTQAAPTPTPPTSAPDPSIAETLATVADRLAAVETRLTSAETAPTLPPSLTSDLAALDTRLDNATRRITAIADEVAIVREGLAAGGGDGGLGPLAASLSEKVQSLTDRIAQVERRPNTPTVAPERLATLETMSAEVSDRLTREIDKSADDLVWIEARIAGIEDRLKTLSQTLAQTRETQAKAGTFLVAAAHLATTAATSGSFAAELAALRATAPAVLEVDAILEILAKHDAGVPSYAVLAERFAATAARVIDASVVGTDQGVVGQALTRVTALISVRRTESAPEGGINALLNEAEAALGGGDLAGAVKALETLDGDTAVVAAGWLADARTRLALDDAVRALQAQALASVSGG
ncbi:MAG: hypothetical protein HQ481_15655 [Alphaproteobacteria bacterium]|nr:hypothetical protein [Alphaproteobacteria bacterium]